MECIRLLYLVLSLLITGAFADCEFEKSTTAEDWQSMVQSCELADDKLFCEQGKDACEPRCGQDLPDGTYWVNAQVHRIAISYQGCYTYSNRLIRILYETSLQTNNNANECARYCQRTDETIERIAVSGEKCYCIKNFRAPKAREDQCTSQCPGSVDEMCGGSQGGTTYLSYYFIDPVNPDLIFPAPGLSCGSIESDTRIYRNCDEVQDVFCDGMTDNKGKMKWSEGDKLCKNANSYLTTQTSAASSSYWIGVLRYDRFAWKPAGFPTDDSCVVMDCSGGTCSFQSRICREKHHGLCKIKPTPPPGPIVKPTTSEPSADKVTIEQTKPPPVDDATAISVSKETPKSVIQGGNSGEDAKGYSTAADDLANVRGSQIDEEDDGIKDYLVYIVPAVVLVVIIAIIVIVVLRRRRKPENVKSIITEEENIGSPQDENKAETSDPERETLIKANTGNTASETETDKLVKSDTYSAPVIADDRKNGYDYTDIKLPNETIENTEKQDAKETNSLDKDGYDHLEKRAPPEDDVKYDHVPGEVINDTYNVLGESMKDKEQQDIANATFDRPSLPNDDGYDTFEKKDEFNADGNYDTTDNILKEWGMK